MMDMLELYNRLWNLGKRLGLKYNLSKEDWQEHVHQCFESVLSTNSGKEPVNIDAYLMSCLKNSYLHSKKRLFVRIQDWQGPAFSPLGYDLHDLVYAALKSNVADRSIRMAFLLRFELGLPLQDVQLYHKLCGGALSYDALRMRLERLRQLLARQL